MPLLNNLQNRKIVLKSIAYIFVAVSILLSGSALALSSGSYSVSPEVISSGGGQYGNAGDSAVGGISSSGYIILCGFFPSSISAADSTPPGISNVRVDGHLIAEGDFISRTSVLTAEVTDNSGINTALSSVEVDGVFTPFSSLSGASSGYDASTGILTYTFGFTSDGTHALAIHAVDVNDNVSLYSKELKINTSGASAAGLYMYPNPFNPLSGAGAIAYNLSEDSDVTLYIFNAVGRIVLKRTFMSGSEGGHTGYNEVPWDGRTDFGNIAGNDIYFVRLLSGGKVVGRTKIAVIR